MDAAGGEATLAVDGEVAGTIDIPRTWPIHGITAGLNCGRDAGTPVSDAYTPPFPFNGRCLMVVFEIEDSPGGGAGAYKAAFKEQ